MQLINIQEVQDYNEVKRLLNDQIASINNLINIVEIK
jgi:hypothetical protein